MLQLYVLQGPLMLELCLLQLQLLLALCPCLHGLGGCARGVKFDQHTFRRSLQLLAGTAHFCLEGHIFRAHMHETVHLRAQVDILRLHACQLLHGTVIRV